MTNRILFVDDDGLILRLVSRLVEGHFEFETEVWPSDSIERLETSDPFAVVVSDFRMPQMDGLQLLSIVQRVSPLTTRVLLSAVEDDKIDVAIQSGLVHSRLNKGCSGEELLECLRLSMRKYLNRAAAFQTPSSS